MTETKTHLATAGDAYTACGRRITSAVPVIHDAIHVPGRVRSHVDCGTCLRSRHAQQILAGERAS